MGVHTLTVGSTSCSRVDPAEMDVDTLHALVVATQRQTHRLAAARARLVAAWDGRQVWAGATGHDRAGTVWPGSARCPSWPASVRCDGACVAGDAADRRRARGGSLSPEHVDPLSAANDGHRAKLFADHEARPGRAVQGAALRRRPPRWSTTGVSAPHGRSRRGRRRPPGRGPHRHRVQDVRRHGRRSRPAGPGRRCRVRRRAQPAHRSARRADLATVSYAPPPSAAADALVEMAIRSRTAPNDGLRPRPLLSILVGEATLAHVCELATGVVLAPGQLLPLLSETDIERIVFDGPDRVMSVSERRTFTGAVRRGHRSA